MDEAVAVADEQNPDVADRPKKGRSRPGRFDPGAIRVFTVGGFQRTAAETATPAGLAAAG